MELGRIEAALGEDDKFMKLYNLRVTKFNRTTPVMTGTFEFLKSIDDDDKYGLVEFNNWNGGRYKMIWSTRMYPLCSGL